MRRYHFILNTVSVRIDVCTFVQHVYPYASCECMWWSIIDPARFPLLHTIVYEKQKYVKDQNGSDAGINLSADSHSAIKQI